MSIEGKKSFPPLGDLGIHIDGEGDLTRLIASFAGESRKDSRRNYLATKEYHSDYRYYLKQLGLDLFSERDDPQDEVLKTRILAHQKEIIASITGLNVDTLTHDPFPPTAVHQLSIVFKVLSAVIKEYRDTPDSLLFEYLDASAANATHINNTYFRLINIFFNRVGRLQTSTIFIHLVSQNMRGGFSRESLYEQLREKLLVVCKKDPATANRLMQSNFLKSLLPNYQLQKPTLLFRVGGIVMPGLLSIIFFCMTLFLFYTLAVGVLFFLTMMTLMLLYVSSLDIIYASTIIVITLVWLKTITSALLERNEFLFRFCIMVVFFPIIAPFFIVQSLFLGYTVGFAVETLKIFNISKVFGAPLSIFFSARKFREYMLESLRSTKTIAEIAREYTGKGKKVLADMEENFMQSEQNNVLSSSTVEISKLKSDEKNREGGAVKIHSTPRTLLEKKKTEKSLQPFQGEPQDSDMGGVEKKGINLRRRSYGEGLGFSDFFAAADRKVATVSEKAPLLKEDHGDEEDIENQISALKPKQPDYEYRVALESSAGGIAFADNAQFRKDSAPPRLRFAWTDKYVPLLKQ